MAIYFQNKQNLLKPCSQNNSTYATWITSGYFSCYTIDNGRYERVMYWITIKSKHFYYKVDNLTFKKKKKSRLTRPRKKKQKKH